MTNPEDLLRQLRALGVNVHRIDDPEKLAEMLMAGARCGCANCSGEFKEVGQLSAQDEAKLAELKSRADATKKRHEEENSKLATEYQKLILEWRDKYQLHAYKEVGLQGNKILGVPR